MTTNENGCRTKTEWGNWTPRMLLSAELPKKILERLRTADDYATRMAQDFGHDNTVVSRILRLLWDLDMVEKTKRTNAQYYGITESGRMFLKKRKDLEALLESAISDSE